MVLRGLRFSIVGKRSDGSELLELTASVARRDVLGLVEVKLCSHGSIDEHIRLYDDRAD